MHFYQTEQKYYSFNAFEYIAVKCPKAVMSTNKNMDQAKCNAVRSKQHKKMYKTVSIIGTDGIALDR